MRSVSRLVLLGILILAVALPAVAKSGFSGTYAVNGVNPAAGAYKGTLTITPKGGVYDVRWTIGTLQYSGVGLVVGDTLSVAYSAGDKSWIGVCAYRERADGSLEGKWAVQGGAVKPGSETAVRK